MKPTYNFCTVIDCQYIPQMLVLASSLRSFLKNRFVLWVFCADQETVNFVTRNKVPGIIPVYWQQVIDNCLRQQRQKSKQNNFYFLCSAKPSFMKYILSSKDVDELVYIDADMMCCADPKKIFSCLTNVADIYLTPHYFLKKHKHLERKAGYFNAGFVAVNKNAISFLSWWQNKCLQKAEWDYASVPKKGGAVDQGYLEDVPKCFKKVKILNKEWNCAPWNSEKIGIKNGAFMTGRKKVVFFHFHQMKLKEWMIKEKMVASVYTLTGLVKVYEQYARRLRAIKKRYFPVPQKSITHVMRQLSSETVYNFYFNKLSDDSEPSSGSTKDQLTQLYHLASYCKSLKQIKSAMSIYAYLTDTHAIVPDHIRAGAFFHRGVLCESRGNKRKAKHCFQRCLTIMPDHVQARKLLVSNCS